MPASPSAAASMAEAVAYLTGLQERIAAGLAATAGEEFTKRSWQSQLGQGQGLLIEGGDVLERAGVNMSQVAASSLPAAATASRPELAGRPYQAAGVSVVVHPRNPYAPTVHLNVRFFTTTDSDAAWWCGGGMDLTPHYGFVEDCRAFHQACRDALAPHGADLHQRFKQACDEYFFIRHRQQARGIGGIFFDDYTADGDVARAQALLASVGDAFLPAYQPILARRKDADYGPRQRAHQLFRRGRYVEFNLVQDRGTLFGLQSGGEIDAILMSLPPLAGWDAQASERDEQDDEVLIRDFLRARDWLAES